MKSFYELLKIHSAEINTANAALSNESLSNSDSLNSAIANLRSNGISHFAIRESLKVNGLIDYDDNDDE